MPEEQGERTDEDNLLKELYVKLEADGTTVGFYIPCCIRNHYHLSRGDSL